MSILTISGSPSAQSRSARLLGHVRAQLERAGEQADHLDLRSLQADALLGAQVSLSTLLAWIPFDLPASAPIRMDMPVLGFAMVVSGVIGTPGRASPRARSATTVPRSMTRSWAPR